MKNEVKKDQPTPSSSASHPHGDTLNSMKTLRVVNEKKSSESSKKGTEELTEATENAVGDLLRSERLRQGKGLREISHFLRISQSYLEAIEEGQHNKLPERVYAQGFVRSYAAFLGFNGEELAKKFKREILGDDAQAPLVFLSPEYESSSPRGLILLLSACVALLCIGGWYFYQHRHDKEAIKEMPAELQKAMQEDVLSAPSVTPRIEGMVSSTTAQPVNSTESIQGALTHPIIEENGPAEEGDHGSEANISAEGSENASVGVSSNVSMPLSSSTETSPPQHSQPQISTHDSLKDPLKGEDAPSMKTAALETQGSLEGLPIKPASVVLTFTEKCWVEVKDANHKILVQKNFYPGETYKVASKVGRQLSVGNAGGVKISVNQSESVPLGAVGMIERISLDPLNLLKYSEPQQ